MPPANQPPRHTGALETIGALEVDVSEPPTPPIPDGHKGPC